MKNHHLLIVGSINMDIVTYVKNHPQIGETIKSQGVSYHPGGKGANQAVSASLSGSKITFIGAIGSDHFQVALINSLEQYGISADHILKMEGSSGLAFIIVNEKGENTITICEGANGKLIPEEVSSVLGKIEEEPKAILLQNEIPIKTNMYLLEYARLHGMKTYYNPAPATKMPREYLSLIDVLMVNESEASHLTGQKVDDAGSAGLASKSLIRAGVNEVIITLGEKGSVYRSADGEKYHIPAYPVQPLDSTAAGDTFIGAFITKQLQGNSAESAIKYASAAAAMACVKYGAQESIPNETEVEAFIANQNRLAE
ncbi:ribokinase [Pseudalkalibacillus sp. R45]|uniref:ribokinase n=1 Tax=Pseudalkalibacillus sp. R45 TaxID=3457433 RepID=UPI003FCEC3B5